MGCGCKKKKPTPTPTPSSTKKDQTNLVNEIIKKVNSGSK